MATPALSARLRFLNDSAYLLARTAPATSKFLVSQCTFLIFESNLEQSASQKRMACGACGTIMVLGWESTLQLDSSRPRRRKRVRKPNSTGSAKGKAMVFTCGSCGSKTRHILSIAPKPSRHHPGQTKSVSLSAAEYSSARSDSNFVSNTIAITSANSNSKKRAKARKKGGLAALLASQKTSEGRGSGLGLDLMDFMKKA